MVPFARLHRQVFILLIIISLVAGCATVRAEETPAPKKTAYEKLVETTAPALVTVKFVLKVQGPNGARDIDRDFTALMIDSKGLVLCSSIQLGTSKLMRRFSGTATPTDIKVLIGDDTEGIEAKLIASDADLDLSWLQIKKPGNKSYAYVNLDEAKTVRLGGRLLSLRRMDKYFDRTPVINEGRLSGITKKPRELLVPSAGLEVEPGMPIFNEDGQPIGIVVVQAPDPEDIAANPQSMGQSTAALILPAEEVSKATKRARATVKEDEEEDDDDDDEAEDGD